MIKKAFVFAAGRGERMGSLTVDTPKPLLKVANKPLIIYAIERLREAGIEEFLINLAYHGEKIERELGNGEKFDIKISYSYEPYPLETGGALYQARSFFAAEPVLMINSDVWTDYPFATLLQKPLSDDVAHLVMVPNPPQHLSGDFLLTPKNRLELARRDSLENDELGAPVTYSGFGVLSAALIGDYPNCREKFPLREVFDFFIQRDKISAELYSDEWQDIGTPERLAALNQKFS